VDPKDGAAAKAPMTAEELADDVLAGAGGPGGEPAGDDPGAEPQGDDQDDIAAVPDPAAAPAPAKGGFQDHDDPDELLKLNQGRAIPYEVFKQKNEKWKAQKAEFEKKLADVQVERAAAGKDPLSPEQIEKFRRLDGVFGNVQKGLQGLGFLDQAFATFAQGKTPDLKALHEALGKHLETMPTGDPRIHQQLTEIQTWREQMEMKAATETWARTRDEQIGEIKKKYPDFDDAAIKLVRRIASGEAALLPDNAPATAFPKLTEIADALNGMVQARIAADRKAQIPKPNRAALPKASAGAGGPGGGQAAFKVYPFGSSEYFEAMKDPAYEAWYTGKTN